MKQKYHKPLQDQLIEQIEAFAEKHGRACSYVTKHAINDHPRYELMKSGGKTCTLRTAEDILKWMDEYEKKQNSATGPNNHGVTK